MNFATAPLNFPTAFCCNCGAVDCQVEVQDSHVTRYFGVGRGVTSFHFPLPVCARCRRSTRRPPPRFFGQLLLFVSCLAVAALLFVLLNYSLFYSEWLLRHVLVFAVVLAVIAFIVLVRLRRPKPPQTSFYQPVRIKVATVAVSHIDGADSRVNFMKLAFTNADYLNAFSNANREALEAGSIAAVKA